MVLFGYTIIWEAWIAGFAVLVSLLTAVVAYYSAKKAQEAAGNANKIAEKNLSLAAELEIIKFREKWLQDLRHEMASFSAVVARHTALSEDDWTIALGHMGKILLLMNPADKDYEKLKSLTLSLPSNAAKDGLLGDGKALEFFDVCQNVLKREWEKIKTDLKDYNA